MRTVIGILLLWSATILQAQTSLILEGRTYNNSSDTWEGVNIPRNSKTDLVFRNNTINSRNRYGYMLQAGDEGPAPTNNNLDGAVISGNYLSWTGTDYEVIPHGIFTGHNSNVVIIYNYLSHVPMGIIRKSGNNMSNTGGGVAYNIVKGGGVGMVVKGMSNVNIFNNTFYGDRNLDQTWRPLVHIYSNTDNNQNSVSHGTKIYNNIFYTRHRTPSITIADQESLTGFECDYNIYWCEDGGSPLFQVNGLDLTFQEWQALGYDTHSVILNPLFNDFDSFIPVRGLEYGTDLGEQWAEGLSVNAEWGKGVPLTARQVGKWQVGAMIHSEDEVKYAPVPRHTQSVIDNGDPRVIEMTFSSPLANIVPDVAAFRVNVNSVARPIEAVAISGRKVKLTLQTPVTSTDKVTIAYIRPNESPLQSPGGGLAQAVVTQPVVNNVANGSSDDNIRIFPNPAKDYFSISNVRSDKLPQVIRIYDMSGRIRFEKRVESDFLYRVPIDLSPGVYMLYLEIGSGIVHKQRLVIVR